MAMSESPRTEPVDPAEVEPLLRERLDGLRAREVELKRAPERGASIGFGKRVGDGTTEAIGRITDVGVADSLDAIEGRILRALEKIEAGSYGICDTCEQKIPAGRLRIAPESALCVRCAAATRG